MIGEHLGGALGGYALQQQRVVGRMVDRVGEAQDGVHRDEHPERIDEAGNCDRGGTEQQAADQIDARAGAVDEETDRRLQHRGDHAEGGERKAKLGVAHAVIRPDEHEQRRQQHHVIVADHVREAHAGDQLGLARAGRSEHFGGLGHCS